MFTEEHLRGLHLRPRCGASRHSDGEAEGGGGASCAGGDWAGANLFGSQEGRDSATCGAEHIPEHIDSGSRIRLPWCRDAAMYRDGFIPLI